MNSYKSPSLGRAPREIHPPLPAGAWGYTLEPSHLPLRVVPGKVPAGFPSPAEDFSVKRHDLNDLLISHAVATFLWRVSGHSMTEAGIVDGAILVVNRALTPVPKDVVVAEVDGELVGFAAGITLAEPKLDFDAELTALYLLPSVQRAGIGRRLLAQVATTLAAAGAPDMLVWVLAQNRKARDFFEGLGAQLLAEQTFNWDELDLVEVAYGWPEIASVVASGTPSLAQ